VSLLVNYVYSLPPFKLSHRTHFAPVLLSFAYVFLPYWLGAVAAGSTIQGREWPFVGGLLIIFVGRIILKDFRDRDGDAAYGKPTFLLRYGKPRTCLVSLLAVLVGNALLIAGLRDATAVVACALELFFAAILFMLYRLWRASDREEEQVAIGVGAKMGNGLLLTVLGSLVLTEYGAPGEARVLFVVVMTVVFLLNFVWLAKQPDYAVIGYRG
jgi:4-hydroxybenzoate polyprenyltransferase